MSDIDVLTVVPDSGSTYTVYWGDGDLELAGIPEVYLDLIPFMLARKLLSLGYSARRLLVVRLQGADYEMVRAPLGAVAATPLVNVQAPVSRPAHAVVVKSSDLIVGRRSGKSRPQT